MNSISTSRGSIFVGSKEQKTLTKCMVESNFREKTYKFIACWKSAIFPKIKKHDINL